MTIGWQEILAVGVVALALFVVIRRLSSSAGFGGCGGSCRPSAPEQQPRIRTLHEVRVSTPSSKQEKNTQGDS